jgi:hypothetical protein
MEWREARVDRLRRPRRYRATFVPIIEQPESGAIAR